MPAQLDHYQRGGGVQTDQCWTCWAQPPTALFVSENVKAEPDTSVHIRPVYSLAIGGMLSTFLPGILTLILMDFLTNRNLWGGRSAPPSYMAIGGYVQYSFLTWVLSWM